LRSLKFPTYSIYVRPQNGATTTDMILESKMMLPKAVVQRSEVKHFKIKKIQIKAHMTKLSDQSEDKRWNARKELKV